MAWQDGCCATAEQPRPVFTLTAHRLCVVRVDGVAGWSHWVRARWDLPSLSCSSHQPLRRWSSRFYNTLAKASVVWGVRGAAGVVGGMLTAEGWVVHRLVLQEWRDHCGKAPRRQWFGHGETTKTARAWSTMTWSALSAHRMEEWTRESVA